VRDNRGLKKKKINIYCSAGQSKISPALTCAKPRPHANPKRITALHSIFSKRASGLFGRQCKDQMPQWPNAVWNGELPYILFYSS